ncbi:hypothetical protein [Ehrlichia ruminantium]|uniref:hypothetical protein n=1 Tax=Ehrlichia ruminantium TaxID=779 RepID=UPI0015DC5DF4|nr:hypothetical protein [Ehrlichia ruminantium]QLK57922.1 hypothetical protein FDZ59_02795 [Ehrlichia ruminantium]
MKFTWVASALASIFVLYINNTFAVDVLSQGNQLSYDQDKSQGDVTSKVGVEWQNVKDARYSSISYAPKSIGRAVVSGQAISYIWSSLGKLEDNVQDKLEGNVKDISIDYDTSGISYDALLRVGAEIRSGSSGIKYGVDFQVAVPNVQGKYFGKKAAVNRGSKIFAATPYGDFSVGYQEGVESIMRLDASSIVAGDDSHGWTHHIRGVLAEEKNSLGYLMYPFLFFGGLYSETVFRSNDNAVFDDLYRQGKDFVNNLPLRLSYMSPSYMGFRFGVSYSPKGYEFNLFDKKFNNFEKFSELKNGFSSTSNAQSIVYPVTSGMMKMNQNGSGVPQFASVLQNPGGSNVFFGAKYEHILSGSVACDYDFSNGTRFNVAIVGEYAHPRLYSNIKGYDIYPKSHSLQGLSIGSVISSGNFNFAAASGYLGKSGFVEKYYYKDKEYPLYERSNTYYWDVALGYKYNAYYISAAYFESNRSGNVLRDIGLGFEYNLLKDLNKMKCKLFGNYHYYDFSQAAITDKVVYNHEVAIYSAQAQTELQKLGYNTREKSEKLKSGSGNIFLVGVKLEF